MQRVLGVFLFFIIIGFLNNAGSDSSSNTPEQTALHPEKQGVFRYTDIEIVQYSSIGGYTAPAGFTYVIVTIHLKNTGHDTYSNLPSYWQLVADGVTYNVDSLATNVVDPVGNYVKIGPGGDYTFKLGYLVAGTHPIIGIKYDGPEHTGLFF